MVQLDWTAADFGDDKDLMPEGIYHVEIKSAELRHSKTKGDAYVNVKLVALDFGKEHLAYDTIMLEGSAWGMGAKKLRAFGYDETTVDLRVGTMVGKRAWAAVKQVTFNKRTKLEVDIDASDGMGYWPDGEPPAGARKPGTDIPDVPF